MILRGSKYSFLPVSESYMPKPKWKKAKIMGDSKCSVCRVEFVMCLASGLTCIAFLFLFFTDLLPIQIASKNVTTVTSEVLDHPRLGVVPKPSNVCFTDTCIKEAARILNNIDKNRDPCKDFYEFSCVGWMKKRRIPEGMAKINVFQTLRVATGNKIGDMLDLPITKNDSRWMKLVKIMDRSCMDTKTLKKLGMKPLVHYLKKLGGWPVVEGSKWNESNHDWVDTIRRMRLSGGEIELLTSFEIVYSPYGRYNLLLDSAEQPKSIEFNEMVNLAVSLGAVKQTATKELVRVFELAENLASISQAKYGYKISFQNLIKIVPKFPVERYLKATTGVEFGDRNLTVTSSAHAVIKALENVSNRTIVNFLVWRFIISMDHAFPSRTKLYTKDYVAYPEMGPLRGLRELCSKKANEVQPLLIAHNYVLHHSIARVKKSATLMGNKIQEQLIKILKATDWFSPKIKKYAIEKAHAMIFRLAYPEKILSNTFLESAYGVNYTLSKESYFQNYLTARKWHYEIFFKLLQKHINRTDPDLLMYDLFLTNAYYVRSKNDVTIPLGILDSAFFNPDRPDYMNYGAIGFVLGHEMTHGFDNGGRQYDKEGKKINWWDEDSAYNFLRQGQCMIEQYSNYSYPEIEMHMNGGMTLPENIADNGGAKESYYAYLNYTAIHGEEQLLPNLNYTARQMFWISLASIFCQRFNTDFLQYVIANDFHSNAPFRVNGIVSNMREFSEDFHCPLGSPMNPAKKCRVW